MRRRRVGTKLGTRFGTKLGFNGAAVMRRRRVVEKLESRGFELDELQWGRRYETAESPHRTARTKRIWRFNGAAVMRRRRESAFAIGLRPEAYGFNGAAVMRRRRVPGSIPGV